MNRWLTVLLRAMFCSLVLWVGAPVFAQSKTDMKKAAEFFNEGETHYNLQEYEEALTSYKEAYRLSQESELLFNIGQCYRLLGKKEEAVRSYKAYLKNVTDPALRTRIQGLITELETPPVATPIKPEEKKPDPPTSAPVNLTPDPKEVVPDTKPTPALVPEKAAPPKQARTFLLVSLGAVAAGSVAGVVSIQAAAVSRQNEQNFDLEQAKEKRNKSVGIAALSDALFVVGIGSGTYALLLKKKAKTAEPVAVQP